MDAQIAALQAYQETGVIGPQPVNPEGSMSLDGGYADGGSPVIGSSDTSLPIEEAAVSQGRPSVYGQLLNGVQNLVGQMFPSGEYNAFELSEFLLENPQLIGAQTESGAAFLMDEAAATDQTPQAPQGGRPISSGGADFLASEDAVIAEEQAAAQSIPANESDTARRLRETQERVRQMLVENGLRTN